MTKRLTHTQRNILSTAAGREDGAVLPLPEMVSLDGKRRTRTLQALIRRGLVASIAGTPGCLDGEENEEPEDLRITRAGLTAIGYEGEQDTTETPDTNNTNDRSGKFVYEAGDLDTVTDDPADAAPKTKVGKVEAMLRDDDGATIAALQDATGWQPHSVRAALTGLRKRGLDIRRESGPEGSLYRIVEG